MSDSRRYFLENDDEMESLIVEYLRSKRQISPQSMQSSQGTQTQSVIAEGYKSCESYEPYEIGKGWPYYKDFDVPGFYRSFSEGERTSAKRTL